MWQWYIHLPGKFSNLTTIRTFECFGTFTESFQAQERFRNAVAVEHLELKAVQVERVVHADDVFDLPDFRRVQPGADVHPVHVHQLVVDHALREHERARGRPRSFVLMARTTRSVPGIVYAGAGASVDVRSSTTSRGWSQSFGRV